MPDILLILLCAVVVNYLVLSGQLDPEWRPATDLHREACRLALLSAFIMLGATLVNRAVEHWILVPLAAQSLQLLVLVATVSGAAALAVSLARLAGMAVSGKEVALGAANGAGLFLAWQIAVLRAVPLTTFIAIFFAITLAAAFGVLLMIFCALMERAGAEVPMPFRGPPLALIVAGLTALALLGLTGLLPD